MSLNCKGKKNTTQLIFLILSVISWITLIIIGWIGFVLLNKEKIIWSIESNSYLHLPSNNINVFLLLYYVPSQMSEDLLYIIFITLMIFVTAGFVIYIIYSICITDEDGVGLYKGMMSSISKFHFIPFICAASLFLIGIFYNDSKIKKDLIVTSVCFSFVGFVCLFLICLTVKLKSPWYINCLIKKGSFSCLIALFIYSTLNNIIKFGIVTEINRLEKMNELEVREWIQKFNNSSIMDFLKKCQIAIPLSIGIINLLLAFVFKDVLIVIMNLLIYIGCTITYYNLDSEKRNNMFNGAEGIIDIIFIILSVVVTVLLIVFYKKKVLE